MLKLIDAEERYLKGYQEAYNLSLEEIKKGNIKKHDLMFYNPQEVDVIQRFRDNRDRNKFLHLLKYCIQLQSVPYRL